MKRYEITKYENEKEGIYKIIMYLLISDIGGTFGGVWNCQYLCSV